MARAKLTDRLIAAGLLVWAATDVPWWWRPPGHGGTTPAVLGFALLMLTQSVPFLWWRRWRLDDLPDLVAGARAAGLPVDLDASDLPPSLPASVELAAFRVVQESLTNALRYAQAPTRVRLACINGGLDVMVENDAPAVVLAAAAAPAGPSALVTHGGQTIAYRQSLPGSGGRGLAGLTERTQILGGTLDAGPQPDGGFEVHAWLPVRP